MQVSVRLAALPIPEYLDFRSCYSAPRRRIAGIYSRIYSYSRIFPNERALSNESDVSSLTVVVRVALLKFLGNFNQMCILLASCADVLGLVTRFSPRNA